MADAMRLPISAPCLGRLALALGLVPAALGGCALGPDFRRPDPPKGEHVVKDGAGVPMEADGRTQRFDRDAELPGRWWERFGSQGVNGLVAQALANSPSLKAAQATLRQSENNLRAGYGVFFPQIGATLGASRQSEVIDLGNVAGLGKGLQSTHPYNLGTYGANVSYVLDIFGAQRRTVEALGAGVDLQRYDVLASYLSLTSNVVNTAIARAGYVAQRDATLAVIRMQDDQIRIARVQFEAGTSTYAAVLALQSQQSSNAAAVAALEQHVEQSEHLLAQLCGKAPADFDAPSIDLDGIALPAELPDAVPAALARRRPDILAAEASLHQASAEIGVATADLFPSLTLGGTAGASNSVISDTLRAGTRFWSAQASLAGSIFNGGSQWYARKAAIDAYDAALAQYQQTVLAALEQVADAMRALDHDAQALRAQADALRAASENVKLTRAQYEAGTAAYLDMLTADAQYQQTRLAYVGAVAQRLQDTVALYAALGGGWWRDDAPAVAVSR